MILIYALYLFLNSCSAQISSVGVIHRQPERIVISESLNACCMSLRGGDYNELMKCTNSSERSYLDHVYSGIPYNNGKKGPKLVVSLLTRATPEIYPYASYSYFLQAAYAEHNGYTLIPLLPDSGRKDYARFRKLVPLSDALRGIAADCDYLVWLDADIVLLDFSMRIEKIASEYPKAHMIVSADVSAPVNSGFIIFRNTPWSLRFIEDWLAVREKAPLSFTDQMGFDYMYRQLSEEEKRKLAILRPDALNSDAPPMGRQLPHNQVLHLAAESSIMRANVFRKGAQEVCTAIADGRQPKHQLGLSRDVIRNVAEMSYGAEVNKLLTRFTAYNYSLHPEDRANIIDVISNLRYDVSKHLYAVAYANNEVETEESINLRRLVSDTLSVVSYSVRDHIVRAVGMDLQDPNKLSATEGKKFNRHPDFVNLLNLFKLSCESSYELLHAFQASIETKESRYYMEWEVLWKEILYKIEFLSATIEASQVFIIMDMKASILGNIGEMMTYLGELDVAVATLRQSLHIYEQLASTSSTDLRGSGDMRAKLGISSSLAKALCIQRKFEEGMGVFRDSIFEESRHVGEYHHNLAGKYTNAGICALQGGLYREARELMRKALTTVERNPHVSMQDTKDIAQSNLMRLDAIITDHHHQTSGGRKVEAEL